MTKYILICLIFLTIHNFSYSQKEDYIWISRGIDNAKPGFLFDFNKDNFRIETADSPLGFSGNNASICDKDGNLLFYTNGRGVMNRFHQVMPNGDSINAGVWADKFWGGPFNGYPGSHNVMILDDAKNEGRYYLFHKPIIYYPIVDSLELHYSYIDMKLDSGRGDVVVKNKLYYDKQNPMASFFTAMKHANKQDWWIIQPLVNDSIFLTFLVDKNGIHRMSDQNTHEYFDDFRSSAAGMAKFSPDGNKYALYTYHDQLHVYDFDRETGVLSNHQKIVVFQDSTLNFGPFTGIEWSPNSRFIYTASHRYLHQIDIWSSDPEDSVILIDTYNGTQDPFSTHINYMAQSPDCRIYVFPKNGTYSLHVINKPDELGKACNFVQNGIKLPYPNGNGSIPNFPRFRVDEIDKCDPTISSIFGEDVYYRRDIEIYPSPSTGVFTIKIPEMIGIANLMITDINGQTILSREIRNSVIEEIDIMDAPAGRYNIEVYPVNNPERVFYGRQVVKI